MKLNKTKSIIITLLFLTFSCVLSAQSSKRGFKLIEKNDYEKAYEILVKILEEEPENVSTQFGLALVYSSESFTQKDYLEAWKYADFTNRNKDNLTQEELEMLTEFYVNTEERRSSRPVKKKVDLSIELILDKLVRQIRESNDVEITKSVLEKFPDFEYYQNTVHIRNYLEYRAVEKENSIEAYNKFIDSFPDAAQIPLAIEKRNKLIFTTVKEKNTLAAYNEFIYNYPESNFVSEAIRLRNKIAFNEAKQKNTIESISSFIESYPDALEVLDAKIIQKQLIYERAKNVRSLDAYDDFIRNYPDGVQYIDIFNLKSKDLGEKLLQRNKYPSQSFKWARVFDNDNKYDDIKDLAQDDSENLILACNTFEDIVSLMNAWIICLDKNGDMTWNKQISDELNDKVERIKKVGDKFYFEGLTRGVNDSIIGVPWIFTLTKEGKKVWNRTYSSISTINAFDVTNNNGELIFGSFYGDSTKMFYLTKLTSELKRMWKREYTNNGVISSVSITSDDQIISGGSNWLFKLDNDGYLKWEQYLDKNDSLTQTAVNNQFVGVAGIRDSLSLFISLYDQTGKKLWDKSFLFQDGIEVSALKLDEAGNVYFAGSSAVDGVFMKLDSKGAVVDELMFGTENKISFSSIILTKNGEVFIAANETGNYQGDKNIVLLKYFP